MQNPFVPPGMVPQPAQQQATVAQPQFQPMGYAPQNTSVAPQPGFVSPAQFVAPQPVPQPVQTFAPATSTFTHAPAPAGFAGNAPQYGAPQQQVYQQPQPAGAADASQMLGALSQHVNNATLTQGGNYPGIGSYHWRLKRGFLHKPFRSNDPLFILEWQILSSNCASHPAGGECSDAIKLGDPTCNGPGNTLAVVAALLGYDAVKDAAEIAAKVSPVLIQWVAAIHAGQFGTGREVFAQVYEAAKKTKTNPDGSPQMYTKKNYAPAMPPMQAA